MKALQIYALGSTDRVFDNVKKYMVKQGNGEAVDDEKVIDYIMQHAAHDDDTPAVYVGTYHKYNSGSLFGMWVDISSFYCYSDFLDFCKAVHSDEKDPELMFQDYQNFPDKWYYESGFSESFDKILQFADYDNKDVALIWIDEMGHDDLDDIDFAYQGQYNSKIDFAEEIADEEFPELSEDSKFYFDYEKFARDLFIDDYYFSNGYVFARNY